MLKLVFIKFNINLSDYLSIRVLSYSLLGFLNLLINNKAKIAVRSAIIIAEDNEIISDFPCVDGLIWASRVGLFGIGWDGGGAGSDDFRGLAWSPVF